MDKLLLILLTFFILASCKNDSKISKRIESEIKKSDLEILKNDDLSADVNDDIPPIDINNYNDKVYKGIYTFKSIGKAFISASSIIIESQQVEDSAFFEKKRLMYIANDKPIALFKNRNPKSKDDVAGILSSASLVCTDTIFYNKIYSNSDKAPMSFQEWSDMTAPGAITFDVWYAIRINGKRYYTDYQPHSYFEIKKYLPTHKQYFILASQPTGYDLMLDVGYPEDYEALVFEQPLKIGENWKQIYRSKKMNLTMGEEYGIQFSEEDLLNSHGDLELNQDHFFKLKWNGKKLILDYSPEYLKQLKESQNN